MIIVFCISIGNQESGLAQVVPDDTLGRESSVLGTGRVDGNVVQMIEGGAARGSNLFHSFREFNIGAGERIYFANPADIDNILSRVTGDSLSTINGQLGVDGIANLFLLNPNGIMFGPDAWLDVAGSFTASTANSFDFADGSRFSASLVNRAVLSISVPLGIQMNGSVQGNIESSGALEAGQEISLLGKQLFLSGSLTTGRNLTLQAQEIVNDASLTLSAEGDVTLSDYVGGRLIVETSRSIETGDLNTSDDGGGTEGGAITLRADRNITVAGDIDSYSFADAGRVENGGNISISSLSGNVVINGDVTAASYAYSGNTGNGGAISVASLSGDVVINGEVTTTSYSYSGNTGNGGAISVASLSGDVVIDGDMNTYSFSELGSTGNGGDITLSTDSFGSISISETLDTGATSTNSNAGNGGNINISSGAGNIVTSGVLDAASTSNSGDAGNSGNITLSTDSFGSISTEVRLDAGATSTNGNAGNGGDINVSSVSGHTEILGLVDSSSYTPYGSARNAGLVSITSTSGNITTGSNIFSDSFSIADNAGSAGGIFLSTELGNIISNGDLSSSSVSRSGSAQRGGTISLLAPSGFIQGNRGQIVSISIAESGNDAGVGGNVTLEGNNISELEVFTLSSSNTSGDVKIQGSENELVIQSLQLTTTGQVEIPAIDAIRGAIIVDTNELGQSGDTTISSLGDLLLNNIIIQSDANGSNPAGNVTIRTPGAVTFSNTQINSNANSTGNAGSIRIDSAELSLGSGDRISAATSALGDGGTITINATESVFLGEGVQDTAPIISVEASGAGKPGSIVINTPNFVLSETARITATSTATATNFDEGGSIDLNANQMDLAGTVGIFAETQGEAPGGILTLQPYQANLNNRNGAQPQSPAISSDAVLTSGSSFDLTLAEGSVISASTTGSGNGGGLRLLAPDAITISGPGRLAVETSSSGQAGDVTATARSLTLADSVVLSASTTEEGNAGNINFNISDQLTIDNSTVESRTFSNSTGQGGNINVNNAAQVSLLNGGNFTLNSEGTGEGGKFTLSADTLTLDSSQITATTQSSNGGDFTFDLGDYLLLRNGSLISTEAGIAGSGGNGGSITINTPNGFVIALPDENSDIRANASEGNGGTVNITARNLLGIAFRPGASDTPSSDITSSSQFGDSGIVTIDELNTETLQPETELPVETAPTTVVARGCRDQASQTGSFVSTGRGGLPTNPSDPLSPQSVWQDLEPLAELTDAPSAGGNSPQSTNSLQSTAEMVNSAPQPITEAQHWSRDGDGTVTLLANATDTPVKLSQSLGCDAGDRISH